MSFPEFPKPIKSTILGFVGIPKTQKTVRGDELKEYGNMYPEIKKRLICHEATRAEQRKAQKNGSDCCVVYGPAQLCSGSASCVDSCEMVLCNCSAMSCIRDPFCPDHDLDTDSDSD